MYKKQLTTEQVLTHLLTVDGVDKVAYTDSKRPYDEFYNNPSTNVWEVKGIPVTDYGIRPNGMFVTLDVDGAGTEDILEYANTFDIVGFKEDTEGLHIKALAVNNYPYINYSGKTYEMWNGNKAVRIGSEYDWYLTGRTIAGVPMEVLKRPVSESGVLKGTIGDYLAGVHWNGEHRHQFLRTLIYTLVKKYGEDYDLVKRAVDKWDSQHTHYQDEKPQAYKHATRRI